MYTTDDDLYLPGTGNDVTHLHSEVLRHQLMCQQTNICAGLRSTRHTNILPYECFGFLCGKDLVGTDNALPKLVCLLINENQFKKV